MKISLFIHIVGIVMWVGSLLVIPTFMKGVQVGVDSGAFIVRSVRKGFFGYFLPGLLMALVSGIFQFSQNAGVYLKQGWFHGKLLFIVVLLIASAMLLIEFKKLSSNQESPKKNLNVKALNVIQALASASLVLISFLTMVLRQ